VDDDAQYEAARIAARLQVIDALLWAIGHASEVVEISTRADDALIPFVPKPRHYETTDQLVLRRIGSFARRDAVLPVDRGRVAVLAVFCLWWR
jgi:hypothetical protein